MPADGETRNDREPLIPVRPEDMPLGKPLPWPLYSRAGQLIAHAGYVIDSAAQRAKLIDAAQQRDAHGIDRSEAGAFLRALGEAAGPEDPDAASLPSSCMLGGIGATMKVSFRLSVHGQPPTIVLPAVLRSQVAKSSGVVAGLQFNRAALERDWHLPLVPKSYVYERTLDAPSRTWPSLRPASRRAPASNRD